MVPRAHVKASASFPLPTLCLHGGSTQWVNSRARVHKTRARDKRNTSTGLRWTSWPFQQVQQRKQSHRRPSGPILPCPAFPLHARHGQQTKLMPKRNFQASGSSDFLYISCLPKDRDG